jgi:hypothetical protein
LADIYHRRVDLAKALSFYRRALSLARHDPDLEQVVGDIERMTGSAPGPAEGPGGLSFAQVAQELMDNPELASLPALQSFLDAITTYRQRSGLSSGDIERQH